MTENPTREEFTRVELERYCLQIPHQLWDLLLPGKGNDSFQFAVEVKRLRIREQERNYVMSIQRKFGIAIRPNETVKEAMTRVRLKRLHDASSGDKRASTGDLPSDPLE